MIPEGSPLARAVFALVSRDIPAFFKKIQIEFIYLLRDVAIQMDVGESDFGICSLLWINEKRNMADKPGIR
jgi:hypothetical protein